MRSQAAAIASLHCADPDAIAVWIDTEFRGGPVFPHSIDRSRLLVLQYSRVDISLALASVKNLIMRGAPIKIIVID